MKRDTPHILLVNPWIHDFAAYDFWAKPLGLLTLASILRRHGFNITYLDCMDRFHAKAPQTDPYARHGRGPYLKTKIPKPGGLEDIPRNFSRYGIKEKWFREDLLCIQKPDLVLVTSMMTYWYTGVTETIGVIKDIFPDVTIVLGGIYASLCHEHALNCSGAHRIQTGPGEKHILKLVGEHTGFSVTQGHHEIGGFSSHTGNLNQSANGFRQSVVLHKPFCGILDRLRFRPEKAKGMNYTLYNFQVCCTKPPYIVYFAPQPGSYLINSIVSCSCRQDCSYQEFFRISSVFKKTPGIRVEKRQTLQQNFNTFPFVHVFFPFREVLLYISI